MRSRASAISGESVGSQAYFFGGLGGLLSSYDGSIIRA